MRYLLQNILHFTRLLGELGLGVQAARALDVAQALEDIEVGHKTDFYHTLRCLLVHRPQKLPVFDEAFRVFWRRPPGDWTTRDLRAMGERRRSGASQVEAPVAHSSGEDAPARAGLCKPTRSSRSSTVYERCCAPRTLHVSPGRS